RFSSSSSSSSSPPYSCVRSQKPLDIPHICVGDQATPSPRLQHHRRRIYPGSRTTKTRGRNKSTACAKRNHNEIEDISPYLVYNIHLGCLLADKRIRGAEGGTSLVRNSPGEEDAQKEEPDCVTSCYEAS
ncbi:unnamed protein product, partial [Pleuronectes platessa]